MAANYDISWLDPRNADTKRVQGALSSWISQYLPNFVPGQPYGGQLSAPMSGFESQGLGFLQQFLDNPDQTPLLKAGQDEIMKTLTGKYDPYTSDFFKATRVGALQNQQEQQDILNQGLGARGKFFSSEALKENQTLGTKTTNFLNQVLGDLSEQERQNQITELGQVIPLDKAITNAPLNKVAASQTFGALPRTLTQADFDRQYQAWLNQRQEMELPIQAASSWRSSDNQSLVRQGKPGFDWGSFLGDAASAAALAIMFA